MFSQAIYVATGYVATGPGNLAEGLFEKLKRVSNYTDGVE